MKLTANQLRIGNLINFVNYRASEKGVLEQNLVTWEDIRMCVESIDFFHLYYKPIPLTEEWLLRMGFSIEEQDEEPLLTNCATIGFEESLFDLLIDTEDNCIYYFNGNGVAVAIKYVHQLQNLYFALTGEELTIKELK